MAQQTNSEAVLSPGIDPDLNFETPNISCEYYNHCRFLNDFSANTGLKLLHINARSLQKMFHILLTILTS